MEEREQNLKLENRKRLHLSGVSQVESSEERRVSLKTVLGDMVIEGEELHIRHLDLESGEAVIGGRVNSLVYAPLSVRHKERQKGQGFGRIFK